MGRIVRLGEFLEAEKKDFFKYDVYFADGENTVSTTKSDF